MTPVPGSTYEQPSPLDAVKLAMLPSASATLMWVVPLLNSECNSRPCCHRRIVSLPSSASIFLISRPASIEYSCRATLAARMPRSRLRTWPVLPELSSSDCQSSMTPSAKATRLPPGEGGGLMAQRAPRCLNTTGSRRTTRYFDRSSSVICPPLSRQSLASCVAHSPVKQLRSPHQSKLQENLPHPGYVAIHPR